MRNASNLIRQHELRKEEAAIRSRREQEESRERAKQYAIERKQQEIELKQKEMQQIRQVTENMSDHFY